MSRSGTVIGGRIKLLELINFMSMLRAIENSFPNLVLLLTLTLGVAGPSHSRLDTKMFLTGHFATILHSASLTTCVKLKVRCQKLS